MGVVLRWVSLVTTSMNAEFHGGGDDESGVGKPGWVNDLREGKDLDELSAKVWDVWEQTPRVAPFVQQHTLAPCSELAPLITALRDGRLGDQIDKIELVLLHNADDPVQTACLPLMAPLLQQWCRRKGFQADVVAAPIDVAVSLNNASDHAQAFSAVVDAVAGLPWEDEGDVLTLLNGLAGAATGKEALFWVASQLGIRQVQLEGVSPSSSDGEKGIFDGLPPGVKAVRSHMIPTSVTEPGRGFISYAVSRSATLVAESKVEGKPREYLERAAEEGILPYVVLREGVLAPSSLAGLQIRRMANAGDRLHSATAEALHSLGAVDSGAADLGDRLLRLLEHWRRSQLLTNNLVPEMVLHNEVHSQGVDNNVAAVCYPLVLQGTLTVEDMFHLGVAAWLHDWGHGSAAITDGQIPLALDPEQVRQYHGSLSQRRIDIFQRQSGLDPVEDARAIQVVRMLAGHHQGKSSFGQTVTQTGGGVPPTLARSLQEDAGSGGLDSARRLVAVFRICDALDIGVHRVPHHVEGVFWDRLYDELMIYLARGFQRVKDLASCDGSEWYDQLAGHYETIAANLRNAMLTVEHGEDPENAAARALPKLDEDFLRQLPKSVVEVLGATESYFTHCLRQRDYFQAHARVQHVHVEMRRGLGKGRFTLVPKVIANAEVLDDALTTVDSDLRRELEGQNKPVGEVLQRMGIRVGSAEEMVL